MKPVKWIADRKDVLTQAVCLLFSLGCVFLFFRFFSADLEPAALRARFRCFLFVSARLSALPG